jgi:hypothetical protein
MNWCPRPILKHLSTHCKDDQNAVPRGNQIVKKTMRVLSEAVAINPTTYE